MKIIEVKNGWKKEVLGVYFSVGNVCNYRCRYCFPGAHEGNHKFPNIDLIKKNTAHLLDQYLQKTNKKQFDIMFYGGEPTHWPYLGDYINFLKQNYNCLISMVSNGSKDLNRWKSIALNLDRIQLSCHHEYVKIDQFVNLCDYLYEQNVIVSVSVMMDPAAWEKCLSLVDKLKKSKHKFTIRYAELIGEGIEYTLDQKQILSKHRARGPNLFWFYKNNKYYKSRVIVVDDKNKKHKFKDNQLLLERMNSFYGWECNLGVDWIAIDHNGDIQGLCGQNPYEAKEKYNFRCENFTKEFYPEIKPTICKNLTCNCVAETNMSKKKRLK